MNEGARLIAMTYGYAFLVSAALAYFLVRVPIQVTDSFVNMVGLDRPFLDLMLEMVRQPGYFRPGLTAGLKVVYDLSAGDYFPWYRGTQMLQVAITVVLFVRLLRVRTRADAAVLPLAVAALMGSQTFAWTVREAFPINTFLTIVVCCAAAANIAFARHRWWTDVLAVVVFLGAALTLESGLLVLVIFVGGYVLGLSGVSRRGVVALLALLGAYLWVRFGVLSVGTPTLLDREAGFGFARRDGSELMAMFGDGALGFYAYNVLSSALNVLTAEPRDGVWRLTRSIVVDGRPDYLFLFACASTTLSTALIVRYTWRRRRAWRARAFDRGDQLVLLFASVLMANAAISYAYTKDVIMSPAGFFFAAAVFVAARDLISGMPGATRTAVMRTAVLLLLLSGTWGVRALGLHVALMQTSLEVREQWAYIDDYFARRGDDPLSPRALALKQQLQHDAVVAHPARPMLRDEWKRLFEID